MARASRKERLELVGDGLMRPVEAANFLGVSRAMIYKLMAAGSITYSRIGGDRKIPRRELIAYAERNLVQRET